MDEYINLQTAKENIVSLTTYNGEEEIRQAVKSARYKEDQWIGGIHDALISLSEIPVADVVEVVRCKYCQRARHWKDGLTCPRMEYITKDGVVARTVSENAFCYWGISKGGKV